MYAIGEASRRSGVGIETIRYYEREGLVPAPERAPNNRRLYSETDIERLRFLRKCRGLGFSLADATTLLDFTESRDADCESVRSLTEAHIANVRAKIDELRRLEAALSELATNCTTGNVECPMLRRLQSG